MDFEIEYLKKLNPNVISIPALKSLKQLRVVLEQPIDAPEPFKSVLQSWRHFKLLAMSTCAEATYPAMTRCWNDIIKMFGGSFDDGVLIEGWSFVDFPCNDGKSYADLLLGEIVTKQGFSDLQTFIETMQRTRLGLYEVMSVKNRSMKIKELVTNNEFEAINSAEGSTAGEVMLIRLFPMDGAVMLFGDPRCFPREHKSTLMDMVKNKSHLYYGGHGISDQVAYERHMKLSGPYWMSVVCPDQSSEILNPDHYLRYL